MLTLTDKKEWEKKQSKKIERELPFFITIVSLLAASGFGPYTIFQKMKDVGLLPTIQKESIKILKRIDMLGTDPLTALSEAKERPSSRALGEFLGGYVSAIQSGGNVINYLKSKMESAFERFENLEKQSVEKIAGLVHGWLTMQIVVLAVFILMAAIGSYPMSGSGDTGSSTPPYEILLFAPIMSIIFMKLVQGMTTSNIKELETKKIIKFTVPIILVGTILILTHMFDNMGLNPYILGGALTAASIFPALQFKKIYTLNMDAELATPQILRDITEARKAGMGPEKCIIHACKRKDFKSFNVIANSIANKLEWGVSLNTMFNTLQNEVKNFQVLIAFRILFEIITSGGGNVNTLDSLADTSEKIYDIQKNKRESLRVYVIVGYMLIIVTGFTTLMTIDSFVSINQEKSLGKPVSNEASFKSLMDLVSIAVIAQAWLAGLFIGRVT
ncbi:MAG TPA: type II secretion system F family protein, partial [Candidatus Bathyarchaeia archaeon]|nr:type II secretion system F family protein [Candidatus Bathyarchaeia archaeon]